MGASGPPPRLYPPVYFLAALIALAGLHHFLPELRWLNRPATIYGGAALIGLAVAFGATSAWLLHRSKTPVRPFEKPTALVTHGPFSLSRNPIYLSMAIALVGCVVLAGTVWPVLVVPLFIRTITRRFIVHEERMLEDGFGERYRAYRKRTRRWI